MVTQTRPQQKNHMYVLLYCDECVCLSVCLSVYRSYHTFKLHQSFGSRYLWLWLGHPLVALRYGYSRFRRWRRVCLHSARQRRRKASTRSNSPGDSNRLQGWSRCTIVMFLLWRKLWLMTLHSNLTETLWRWTSWPLPTIYSRTSLYRELAIVEE